MATNGPMAAEEIVDADRQEWKKRALAAEERSKRLEKALQSIAFECAHGANADTERIEVTAREALAGAGVSETVAEHEARTSALAIARKVLEVEAVRAKRADIARLLEEERASLGLQGDEGYTRVLRILKSLPEGVPHSVALVLAKGFLSARGLDE